MNHLKEKSMRMVFMISACASILSVAMICIFLFANGIPAIGKIGIFDFLLGEKWKPGNDIYGILPMILGSIYVTAGAIVGSHRHSDCYFHVPVLSPQPVPDYEAGH